MSDQGERIETLFAAALQKSPAERGAYLDQACGADPGLRGRIEALLRAHDRAGSFLDVPDRELGTVDYQPIRERAGTVIGPYKLMEQIGEGGMGLVFVAEQQEPVRRKVALKIIKPGMDSREIIARFEAERQALALMDHPNIARILDAGTTESGKPYFVMELVKGIPITNYCDQCQLTPRERLGLFVSVCQAVQHAHLKGVVHRDLKPSNVLITEHDGTPVAKVIDFGVAKAIGPRLTEKTIYTGFAQMIGTSLYMSPEQAAMSALDVDTRSDVFALGVLLYELLTGTTPFDAERMQKVAFDEVRRIIREEEPPRPSTRLSTLGATLAAVSAKRRTEPAKLSALVRGELDWIVMKALEKDRNRRYETATGLAQDVQRFLHDEPVQAGPPGATYRLRKFVKRNRGPVLAGAALASVCGIAAVVLLVNTLFYQERLRQLTAAAENTKERARDLEQVAQLASVQALQERQNAQKASAKAQHALETAEKITEGLRLTHASERVRPANPTLALLLGIEGAERNPGLVGNNALLEAMELCQEERTIRLHQWLAGAFVAWSPDGRRILTPGSGDNACIWEASSGKLLLSLGKVEGGISSACFSPDGRRVATWSLSYRGAQIWDTANGQQLCHLDFHKGPRNGVYLYGGDPQLALSFSPNGSRFVTALATYPDCAARVWETDTGTELVLLKGHTSPATTAVFSHDGKRIVTASLDKTARIWDAGSGKELCLLEGHKGGVYAARFSPDGKRVITVGDGKWLKFTPKNETFEIWTEASERTREEKAAFLWDAESGKEVAALHWPKGAGTGSVRTAQFSPDGRVILSVGGNGLSGSNMCFHPALWEASTGKLLFSLQAPEIIHEQHAGAFSPDGRFVVTESPGRTAKLWDVKTGEELAILKGHEGEVRALAFSNDGKRVVSAAQDGTARIWNARVSTEVALRQRDRTRMRGLSPDVSLVTASPDGRRAITRRGNDLVTRVHDLATGTEIPCLEGRPTGCFYVRFSADGTRGVTVNDPPSTAWIWDASTGKELAVITDPTGNFRDADISPDGRLLATAEIDKIRIWDFATGKLKLLVPDAERRLTWSARFSPDGRWLLTTNAGPTGAVANGMDADVRGILWDAATGKLARKLLRPQRQQWGTSNSAVFSPDGQHVLFASGDKTAAIHEVKTGKELLVLRGHTLGLSSAAYDSSGARIVTASEDQTARIWDAATGRELAVLKGHEAGVRRALFSPDGKWVLTLGSDGTARVWHAESAQEVATLKEAYGFSGPIQFGPDSASVVRLPFDGTPALFPIDILSAAKQRKPRELTDGERDRFRVEPR